jgi:methyl-accepting chemotaxis protein
MFENMKLSKKLVSSFLVVAMLGLIVGAIGVVNMSRLDDFVDKVYSKDLMGISLIKEAKVNRLTVALDWRSAILESDPLLTSAKIASTRANIKLFKENLEESRQRFTSEKAAAVFVELDKAVPEWERLTLQMVAIIEASDLTEITPEFTAILAPQRLVSAIIDEKMSELGTIKEVAAQQTSNESTEFFSTSLVIMIILLTVSFVISIFLGLALARSIMRQLGGEIFDAVNHVSQISNGNFSTSISLQPRDNGSLLYALKNLQNMINTFVSEQQLIASKHAEGFISHNMDVRKFQGTYAQMANGINALAQSHIAVKMSIIAIVAEYAKGDFSRDIERLPQEKAIITETIDEAKSALIRISKEIENLVNAGTQGDFSQRSNSQDFNFLFKEMLVNLNMLMETCEVSFGDVLQISNALAQGDLTQTITNDYPDGTFNNVKNALNGTAGNLKALVGEIKESADTINTASQEIAAGNNDLSHRTEQQAASLEETAASMQELTSTVQANSENAKHANEMALASSDIARKGVAVVNQVVHTMESINESSRKVVDIITVIDGIAFQTNILALNAAVEAARAGEQGRGFAVVATEVRSLAQRAAAAAGEIKALISDSVDKVEDGTALVARAGKTMEEIVNSIQDVTATIGQITAASSEQTAGIEQVNEAISQMDDVTQQNAALVEEAAAASEALEDQARNLSITMGNFKTTDTQSESKSAPVMKMYESSASTQRTTSVIAPLTETIIKKSAVLSDDWEEF